MTDTCRRIAIVALLMMLLASCTDMDESQERRTLETSQEDFASFSQNLYAALAAEPLDSMMETETGLFGGMAVGAGERIVMGRYRYRVDSAEYGPIGRMAFQIRDAGGTYDAVPVVLQFVERDGNWRLEDVSHFGPDTTSMRPDDSGFGPSSSDEPLDPLARSLTERLDPWVDAAVDRVEESDED